jgi:hypothetical protein
MSLFPGSVYSSPGVLQGDLSAAGLGGGLGAGEANLVVSTLIAASTIQTSTLVSYIVTANSMTASTISMPAGGVISGVSSISAAGAGNILNMNGGILNNLSSVNFGSGGQIVGLSTISAAGNTLSIPGSITGLTNISVSSINGTEPATAVSLGTFATQGLSTFNTNGFVDDISPTFGYSFNSNVLTEGNTYQLSFTASVAQQGSAGALPAPVGDSFSWTIVSGATNIKAYQITTTELAQQSQGTLSSIRESVTAVFTAGGAGLQVLPGYVVGAGTNYQYPSTVVSFTGATTLIDLGLVPLV